MPSLAYNQHVPRKARGLPQPIPQYAQPMRAKPMTKQVQE
jgi:hypothetical protein